MSAEYTLKIDPEQAKEMPMVDLAFLILKEANTPFYYRDLMQEVAKIKGISDDEVMNVIAQLYTEINIDGRFACVGNNLWGLKRWYPVEKAEDAMGSAARPRIINDDDDDLDDDLYEEEEGAYDVDEEYVGEEDVDDLFGSDLEDDVAGDLDELGDLGEDLDDGYVGELDEELGEVLDEEAEEEEPAEEEEEDN